MMDSPAPGGLGGTYAGSPVACAAALAVMQAFDEERLLEKANVVGLQLTERLTQMQQRFPAIAEVRGLGAMVALELVEPNKRHTPDAALAKRIVTRAAEKGLILLSCGVYGNVIRILVPLTASAALIAEGLDILDGVMRELCGVAAAA
jgi:4-aminobutyrate aminotransferase/(S)-3-amino-2-methylpropionate transaminase